MPALMMAAGKGSLETVKLLAESGAFIDEEDIQGYDAAWYAEKYGHSSIVEYLRNAPR